MNAIEGLDVPFVPLDGKCLGIECPYIVDAEQKLVAALGSMAAVGMVEATIRACTEQEGCRVETNLNRKQKGVQDAS